MRVAVLILAHKNPDQLGKLVLSLVRTFDVFVHIDKKARFNSCDLPRVVNLRVVKKHKISWGSFAMVEATLDLIRLAGPQNYARFILISGQDLPIKSNGEILKFYSEHSDTNFMQSLNLKDWDSGGLERVTHWHFRSPIGTRGLAKLALRISGFALSTVQKRLGFSRKMEWEFFCGSQWVDLTGETARAILSLTEANPAFLRRFRATTCSDEIFFQTAVHFLGLENTCSPAQTRYIDWSSGPEFPRTLRISDLEQLQASPALFARKFDSATDNEVIDHLLQQ